ncbi:MAG: hypothetical protein A4E62_02661 [Syntrophorhabdus sp. PtaU1.Bin002]|nr:MAG: hypothetical protein A4E62_02661 [Syntrophorhabdus sp. PtaU1.Bin002]
MEDGMRLENSPSPTIDNISTLEATRLMRVYETLRADTEDIITNAYRKCFGTSIQVQFYTITPHKRGRKNLMG